MKKSAVTRIVIWSCIALVLIGLLIFLLCVMPSFGDWNWNFFEWNVGYTGMTYDDASEYSVGDAEIDVNDVTIRKIVVDWVSGYVMLEPGGVESDKIKLFTHDEEIEDQRQRVRWLVKNDTLYIRFCESGFWLNVWKPKQLSLTLPPEVIETVEEITIDSASAQVRIGNSDAEFVGSTGFDYLSLKKLVINTVSGDLFLEDFTAQTIEIDAVSAKISTDLLKCPTLTINTVSGDTELRGSFSSVEFDGVSGRLTINSDTPLKRLEADTTSGNIMLTLPTEQQGFTLSHDSVSGDFESEIPIRHQNGKYIYGDGSATFKVDSVSGDVTVDLIAEDESPAK